MTSDGDARYSRRTQPRTQGFRRQPAGVAAETFRRGDGQSITFLRRRQAMKKVFAALLASVFALSAGSALACPGDKAKDEKQMSTPSKPKV